MSQADPKQIPPSRQIPKVNSSGYIRPSNYQDYSPQFKADALILLEANGGKVKTTARQLGIADTTLAYWVEKDCEESREIRAGAKGEIASAFERVARIYLDRAAEPDAVEKTSGYYAVIASESAMKTSQLLRGQPTSILGTLESKRAILAEIQAKHGVSAERAAEIVDEVFADLEGQSDPVSPAAQIEP